MSSIVRFRARLLLSPVLCGCVGAVLAPGACPVPPGDQEVGRGCGLMAGPPSPPSRACGCVPWAACPCATGARAAGCPAAGGFGGRALGWPWAAAGAWLLSAAWPVCCAHACPCEARCCAVRWCMPCGCMPYWCRAAVLVAGVAAAHSGRAIGGMPAHVNSFRVLLCVRRSCVHACVPHARTRPCVVAGMATPAPAHANRSQPASRALPRHLDPAGCSISILISLFDLAPSARRST